MENTVIYELNGCVGDILYVYEDRIVIKHKGILNFMAMGLKGDKTIFFSDLTSIQLKKAGLTSGYLQFSLPGGKENTGGVFGATQDENTITFVANMNNLAEEVHEYINTKIRSLKNTVINNSNATLSIADELHKFKELLDMGVISQEEFDTQKKQLLNVK